MGDTSQARTKPWQNNLSPEQVRTVAQIRKSHEPATTSKRTEGWTVYCMPTTQPVLYLELRHYLGNGRVARWVIERDGSVSAHNDRGQLRRLIAV